jgi:hypothetical protein
MSTDEGIFEMGDGRYLDVKVFSLDSILLYSITSYSWFLYLLSGIAVVVSQFIYSESLGGLGTAKRPRWAAEEVRWARPYGIRTDRDVVVDSGSFVG